MPNTLSFGVAVALSDSGKSRRIVDPHSVMVRGVWVSESV